MSIHLSQSDDTLKEKFFALADVDDVVDLLELSSYSFLEYLLYVMPASKRYTKFIIPKKRGGRRIIQEPTNNLKIVQQKLLQVLEVVYQPKPSVHGFCTGRSIVTNAQQHSKNNRFVLNVDLKDFFPSIHFGRVQGMFKAYPYRLPHVVATILAQICSLPTGLPQGAPTSPIISNMLCARLDQQLQRLAKEHRCYYTRYADDITFSTSLKHFPNALAVLDIHEGNRFIQVGSELSSIINGNGFVINKEKVRLQTKNQRQEVTGLVVNESVNVNRKFIRQIRAMLHAWDKFGYDLAQEEYHDKYCHKKPIKPYQELPSFRQVVKGKIGFVGMVRGQDDYIFRKLNNLAARLEQKTGFSSTLFTHIENPSQDILAIIAKGETEQVEFKEGACLDPHKGKKDNNMSDKIVKEVTALMNTMPKGILVIGVKDSGTIVGVEREYPIADPRKSNWDGYELFLRNKIDSSLSITNPSAFYQIKSHRVEDKIICAIYTTRATKPVLAKGKLIVRSGTKAVTLSDAEQVDYMINWSS